MLCKLYIVHTLYSTHEAASCKLYIKIILTSYTIIHTLCIKQILIFFTVHGIYLIKYIYHSTVYTVLYSLYLYFACLSVQCAFVSNIHEPFLHDPRESGGRQAAIIHHYFPFRATYYLFSLPAAVSHHYFPFRTTTFDSSGQNFFFKWYI